ncbi:MAG TPA: dihydroneopterin aldolase [Cytophagaceae bacterium]|jgi:dihydroneopterin aldolase|nr:dihydroneopterin aldolase [Cytophagaceae bacterium]
MTYEIRLEGLKFHAYHGVYEYEQKAGNTFVLDLSVRFPLAQLPLHDAIEETPDYQLLHLIAADEMKIPRRLLETVAFAIFQRLWETFPEAVWVKVSIKKNNPPIGTSCQASAVVLESATSLSR